MSPSQIALWLEYHDVVLNDNTAKTNRYNMPLSLFLIVDNNTKSRLVAQSLVSDEMVETYKWILECTKKATMTEPMVFVVFRIFRSDPDQISRKFGPDPTRSESEKIISRSSDLISAIFFVG